MKTPVSDHYEQLLGPVYSWSVGDPDAATARADAELSAVGLPQAARGYAIDLGAGFGLHAVPLARRGYRVLAIDTYGPLLHELARRAAPLAVQTATADLLDFRAHATGPADVILCMGDTLTHLADAATVQALFDAVAAALAPGGLFVATFRDYAAAALQDTARFIHVRGDDERILTCFLEYGAETVRVHDLLHERVAGTWRQRVHSYPKLRLAPEWVVATLASRGLAVRREAGLGGMVRVVAQA